MVYKISRRREGEIILKNTAVIKVAVQFGKFISCRRWDVVCVHRHFLLCSLPAYPSKPTNLIHFKRKVAHERNTNQLFIPYREIFFWRQILRIKFFCKEKNCVEHHDKPDYASVGFKGWKTYPSLEILFFWKSELTCCKLGEIVKNKLTKIPVTLIRISLFCVWQTQLLQNRMCRQVINK